MGERRAGAYIVRVCGRYTRTDLPILAARGGLSACGR
jgi:hypothetical protein